MSHESNHIAHEILTTAVKTFKKVVGYYPRLYARGSSEAFLAMISARLLTLKERQQQQEERQFEKHIENQEEFVDIEPEIIQKPKKLKAPKRLQSKIEL